MKQKISFDQLVAYFDGALSSTDQDQITNALRDRHHPTQTDAAWLRRFYAAAKTLRYPTSGQQVTENLQVAFARKFSQAAPPSSWQRFKAFLSVDSWGLQGAAVGARSAEFEQQTRQLAFTTDPVDIILAIHTTDEGFTITGQLLPNNDEADETYACQLIRHDENAGLVLSDDLGEFDFGTLPPGQYQPVFSTDILEVWLPLVDLN